MEKANRDKIPHLDVFVSEERIEAGAKEILKLVRPLWKLENVKFKLLTDGITNKLVKCKLPDDHDRESVLIRIYGIKTDMLIDRTAETRNIFLLNGVGLAPSLYATFQNGLVYEFVPGCTLSDITVVLPHIYHLVAVRMAKMHKVCPLQQEDRSLAQPMLWNKFSKFLSLVPDTFTDSCKQERYENLNLPSKQKIQTEAEVLKSNLIKLGSPLVFSHNDLLLGNIVYSADKNCVTFIDFEYSALNYQAFDIGNHFAEFVGLDNIDYSKYPSKDLQYDWLRTYLNEFRDDGEITEQDVATLYVQANQFALAAHLFWAVWSLIQAEHSTIDFNFIRYASIRLNEYFSKKETFLSLKLPS